MTIFELLRLVDNLGYLERLCDSKVLNRSIWARYSRYKRYCEHSMAHPGEKHYDLLLDLSIELDVSVQTLYDDIRMMEKPIL
jgi:hypothetical protein